MPAKRKPAKPAKRKKATPARRAGKTGYDLRCTDCDFVAAHPMGLGRHRSTRHGAISKRAARDVAAGNAGAGGTWITRQQAAERAGVHYNTIRQWERSGGLRKGSHPGARETLVSAADVLRLATTRGGHAGDAGLTAVDAARLNALERTQRELADGLEHLAAALRAGLAPARKATPRKSAPRRAAKTVAERATKKRAKKAPTRAPKRTSARRRKR